MPTARLETQQLLFSFAILSYFSTVSPEDPCICKRQPYVLKIGAPKDGSEIHGPFAIRVDFSRPTYVQKDAIDDASAPWGFELVLDGQTALQIPLSNQTRSFYLVNVGGLDKGVHTIEVVLLYEEEAIPGSPEWSGGLPQISDRCTYFSHGSDPAPDPLPHVKVPGLVRIPLRKRVQFGAEGQSWPCDPKSEQKPKPVLEKAVWQANLTAVLVLDMWGFHGCAPARHRVDALAGPINSFLIRAREHGAMVIHAPSSGVEEMAPAYPTQRARMIAGAAHGCADTATCPAAHITHAGQSIDRDPSREPPLPFPSGCDDASAGPPPPWDHEPHAQHPAVAIFPADGLSDSAREIVGFLRANGLTGVLLVGVHANECVLRRPFAARGLRRAGFAVAVARDLTDVLYDPRDPPRVSRARASALMMAHLEAYVAPTFLSADVFPLFADGEGDGWAGGGVSTDL